MPDVVLVQMPFSAVEHPSIALGILSAALRHSGITVQALFPNLDFCAQVGFQQYRLIDLTRTEHLVGEWVFADVAFPAHQPDQDAYLSEVVRASLPHVGGTAEALRAALWALRREATKLVEETAKRIVALCPRAVGASSVFQQHCASLALLRRIRELDPSVITVLGGANCEAEIGVTTRRCFPWVDFVVSGEADEVFVPLCRAVLESGRQVSTDQLPQGVISGDPATWTVSTDGAAPRARVMALDKIPTPDYDDWFEALAGSPVSAHVVPGLLVETSRGCWWGQKHHCTFCGLNGIGMGYRAKSAPRVLEELAALSARYRINRLEVVDNILDNGHMKTVIPQLAAQGTPYTLFYETKSNLRRDQVRALAEAGVLWIQPGIESLSDDVLKLMDKGTDGLSNIELLKWAREHGVRVIWNFLVNFPGERDAWYAEMAHWLPRIAHLQPPVCVAAVRYDRFSPYQERPQHYGIEIRPARAYANVYPLPPDEIARLAYFFEDVPEQSAREDRVRDSAGRYALRCAVDQWIKSFFGSGLPPLLSVSDDGETLRFLDTRPMASQRRVELSGLTRRVYLACETAQTSASALARLRQALPEATATEVTAALEELDQSALVLRLGSRYLALGVSGRIPSLPPTSGFPGGLPWVDAETVARMGPRPLWPPPGDPLCDPAPSPSRHEVGAGADR